VTRPDDRETALALARAAWGAAAGAGDGPDDAELDLVRGVGRCTHMRVGVNVHARCVGCLACGAALDAFDVLAQYAHDERRLRSLAATERATIERLRRDRAALQLEVAELQLQRENLRTVTRGWGGGR
jgi:hypothetical protein